MEWRTSMNKKYKIVAFFGPAGSGKDYIQWHLMHTDCGDNYLHKIVSCTTRPPREREINGINYYFVSEEEFKKKDFLEYTTFRNWWYGTPVDSLDINKINVGIFNTAGIHQLINSDISKRVDCLPIYIKTNPRIRLLRQLQRENEPDCDEIIRRYLTDQRDFKNLTFSYKIIENNTDEVKPILSEIIEEICDWAFSDK